MYEFSYNPVSSSGAVEIDPALILGSENPDNDTL